MLFETGKKIKFEKMTCPYHFKKFDFHKGIPLQKSNFLKRQIAVISSLCFLSFFKACKNVFHIFLAFKLAKNGSHGFQLFKLAKINSCCLRFFKLTKIEYRSLSFLKIITLFMISMLVLTSMLETM